MIVKDQEELGIYLMECGYVEEEACELAQKLKLIFLFPRAKLMTIQLIVGFCLTRKKEYRDDE